MEFINKDWQKVKRQRCEIITRVMWYYRPVSAYNIWKKSEFYSRKYFKHDTNPVIEANFDFIKEYSKKVEKSLAK